VGSCEDDFVDIRVHVGDGYRAELRGMQDALGVISCFCANMLDCLSLQH
jgi:hypothetical protein